MDRTGIRGMLDAAGRGGYALGSFSPRTTALIDYVMLAARDLDAPLMVQISSNEFRWFDLTAADFADAYRAAYERVGGAGAPCVLHLDHTRDLAGIEAALDAGFESVMIDASALDFEANVALSAQASALAHARGAAVEAELGRIGAADRIESDHDEELYTLPDEAGAFVLKTGVDSLAVSVGSAHGVYAVKDPKIDFERLEQLNAVARVPLVLHGGSGLPEKTLARAVGLHGGGVSKINFATDLELAFLGALGRAERLSNAEVLALEPEALARAGEAVREVVRAKIRMIGSAGKAPWPKKAAR